MTPIQTVNISPASNGAMTSTAPTAVPAPLPPRNPKKTGQQWPMTAANAQAQGATNGADQPRPAWRYRQRTLAEPGRQRALADIDDDDAEGESPAGNAQRVGATGIATALGADVDAAHAADDEAAGDRTEQIGDDQLADEQHHDSHLPSSLRRSQRYAMMTSARRRRQLRHQGENDGAGPGVRTDRAAGVEQLGTLDAGQLRDQGEPHAFGLLDGCRSA